MAEGAEPPPRLSEDNIQKIVRGLVAGRIYTASMVPEDMLSMVFMPLMFAADSVDWSMVGNVIGDLDHAQEQSFNGYPIFPCCRIVHKDDWRVITDRALAAAAALDRAVKGNGD